MNDSRKNNMTDAERGSPPPRIGLDWGLRVDQREQYSNGWRDNSR